MIVSLGNAASGNVILVSYRSVPSFYHRGAKFQYEMSMPCVINTLLLYCTPSFLLSVQVFAGGGVGVLRPQDQRRRVVRGTASGAKSMCWDIFTGGHGVERLM